MKQVKVNPVAELIVGEATPAAVKLINAATPGFRTSEFYLSLAVIVCALILTLADKITGEVGLGAITATGVGYAVSRGLAKT